MNKQAAEQQKPLVFFQLTKVDEQKRLVYGRAAAQVRDRVGETFDYATSKPNFEKWSKSQSEASMGKSAGNVRAMHKDIAAGIIVPGGMTFNDADRAIDMVVKVTDDNEWNKTLSGTYTGFSIGGRYAKKWAGEDGSTHYTAEPSEVSLVDRPCIPSATFFEIQKADGALVKMEFVAKAEDLEKAWPPKDGKKGDKAKHPDTGEEMEHDGEKWQKCESKKADSAEDLAKAEQEREATEHAEKMVKARELYGDLPVIELRKGLEAVGHTAETLDMLSADGLLEGYHDAMLAIEKNDGGIDIEVPGTAEEVDQFIKLLADNKLRFADALKMVTAVVTRKPELLGGAYGDFVNKAAPVQLVLIEPVASPAAALRKNLMHCANFAVLLDGLCKLYESVSLEQQVEGDEETNVARMMNGIVDLGKVLSDMVMEEVSEQAAGTEAKADPGTPVSTDMMALAEKLGGLKKREPKTKALELAKVDAGALAKLEGENAALAKRLADQDAMFKRLNDDIELLKKQPARTSTTLRVFAKGQDLAQTDDAPETVPVKDAFGKTEDAATLIKSMHKQGGQPLHLPLAK